ncbi:MAG: SGNH/GDSL hydrolase family protein [Candidatus Nanopelagicales bacterium]
MSHLWKLLVSFVLVVATALGGGASASAHRGPTDVIPGLPIYLALGDSIANGQQSAPEVPGDYWATVAGWQANGYVAQFRDDLKSSLNCLPGKGWGTRPGCEHLQLVNLARSAVPAMDGQPAKPGVTTTLLIAEQLPAATKLLKARNWDKNPRNDVEVVTLTVGGNDAFEPITTACLAPDPSGCPAAIKAVFDLVSVNYSQILAQLRSAAGPDAQIMTMTYYNPVPYCALGQGSPSAGPFVDWVLQGGVLPGLGDLPVGFNDLIEIISAQYGATVADTYGADLGDDDFVGGADCLHPNKAGHTKIAAAFSEALSAAGGTSRQADVRVKSIHHQSKLYVNVDPNLDRGFWEFTVQTKRANGSWRTLPKTYRTFGRGETRVLDFGKGIYRVEVKADHGYQGTTSSPVSLRR